MNLSLFLAAARRGWAIILISTVLGVGVAGGLAAGATKYYTATAVLYFSVNGGPTGNDINQGGTFTQNQMASFALLADSTAVLEPVIRSLHLAITPAALAKSVIATSSATTVEIQLAVSDPSPTRAASIANAAAASLSSAVRSIAPKDASANPSIMVHIIEPAVAPTAASSPNLKLALLLGGAFGLIMGMLIVLVRELAETRVRSESIAAEVTGSPVLGSLLKVAGSPDAASAVILDQPLSAAAERYRQLRSNLEFVTVGSASICIIVTSSIPGEGKSTIAANLALCLGEAGTRTLLIDADLRRPTIAQLAGVEPSVGLTTVLVGHATFDEVVQEWGDSGVSVLTAGAVPPNPSELLASRAMTQLLAQVRGRYDAVLVDTAPVAAAADAGILGPQVDGAVVIVDRTRVRRAQLAATKGSLTMAGTTVLGLIMNRLALTRDAKQHAYYSSGGALKSVRASSLPSRAPTLE